MQFYKYTNTNYELNGDLKLNPIKSTLRVELNTGNNALEIELPYDNEGKWKEIEEWDVLKTGVFYSENPQLYRIYNIDKDMYSLIIRARHIAFDLVNKTILDLKIYNCSGRKALNKILKETKFVADCNIEKDFNFVEYKNTNVIEAINGTADNSFRNLWGGELLFDNYTVILRDRIGTDNGLKIKYTKDLESVDLTIDRDNIITRAYPQGYEGIMLPEQFIDSPLIDKYPIVCESFVNMEDLKMKNPNVEDDEGYENIYDLYSEMRTRVKKMWDNGADKPKISGTVKIKSLINTLEYKDFKNLVKVNLGDTVTIEHKALGVNIKTRVVSATWDTITKDFTDLEFGDVDIGYFNSLDKSKVQLDNILKGDNVNGEKVVGTLKDVLVTNKNDSMQLDFRGKKGGAVWRCNGNKAVEIKNNIIKFFNWEIKDKVVGGLKSFLNTKNIDFLTLFNSPKSSLTIGQLEDDGVLNKYITFDLNNNQNDTHKHPIRIYRDVDVLDNDFYNFNAYSYNKKFGIEVTDDYLRLLAPDFFLVMDKYGMNFGNQAQILYNAEQNRLSISCDVYDGNGNLVLKGRKPPTSDGGTIAGGDWKNGIMSANMFRFLKGYEGLGQYEYRDSGGTWTIGYGITGSERDVYNKLASRQPVSEELAAKEAYEVNNRKYGKAIVEKVKALGCTTQQQFDALIDLAYNCGTGVIGADNSLMRALRTDMHNEAYVRPIWEKFYIRDNSGQALEGLRLRRKAECDVFFKGIYEKRRIPILDKSGNVSGSYVTENGGDGWLPINKDNVPPPSTDGLKRVNNEYGKDWIVPVTGCRITAGFPVYPSGGRHDGMDFGCSIGTPVRVSKNGTVIKRRELTTSYGKYLFVDHGGGLVTIYAHNSELLVNEGDYVKAGQIIAKSGSTGNSSGPHLHWELRVNGVPKDVAPTLHTGDYV